MPIRTQIKAQILDKPVLQFSDENSRSKWGRAVLQVWTGMTASSVTVYAPYAEAQKDDFSFIEKLDKGEYIFDLEESSGDDGVEFRLVNPRISKSPSPQAKQ